MANLLLVHRLEVMASNWKEKITQRAKPRNPFGDINTSSFRYSDNSIYLKVLLSRFKGLYAVSK